MQTGSTSCTWLRGRTWPRRATSAATAAKHRRRVQPRRGDSRPAAASRARSTPSSQLVCRVGYVPAPTRTTPRRLSMGRARSGRSKLFARPTGAARHGALSGRRRFWGPGMSAHYRRFLSMIERGLYFHVGNAPALTSLTVTSGTPSFSVFPPFSRPLARPFTPGRFTSRTTRRFRFERGPK